MPVLSFVCRACGAGLEVDEELAGRPVACGHCQAEQPAPGTALVDVPVVHPVRTPGYADATEESEPASDRRRLSPVGRVALLVAALFGLFAAGGVALTLAKPGGWKSLRPDGGRFVIDMPGRIRPTPETREFVGGVQPLTLTVYKSERRAIGRVESAEVGFVDLPAAPKPEDVGHLLDVFANALAQQPGHEFKTKKPVTLDGHPAVAVLVELENKYRVVFQLTIRDGRLFILSMSGPRYTLEHAQAVRFFNSFHYVSD